VYGDQHGGDEPQGAARVRDRGDLRSGARVHIAPYKEGSIYNADPIRNRRLLLHRREINRLATKTKERGYTIIPLRVYFKGGYAKVELGLARGKKTYDKRRKLRDDDEKRRTQEAMKRYSRGQKI